MRRDGEPADIEARIRAASEKSDLRAQHRLATKVDLSADGIARRIKAASEMLTLCRQLGSAREGRVRSPRG